MRPRQAKRDLYSRLAKKRGYKSRAAFKLIQLHKKYGIFSKGDRVLDLGCAPGGWLQVASKYVGRSGLVVGVDKRPVKRMPGNVRFIKKDIYDEGIIDAIREVVQADFDVVLSDLSPDVTGIWELDSIKQIDLSERALKIAKQVLKEDGRMVVKVFQGEFTNEFLKALRKEFDDVRLTKPPASRPESSELYAVCFGLKKGSSRPRGAPRKGRRSLRRPGRDWT